MNLLYQSAFSEALGWSLVDSLWKTGALWMLYTLLTANGKKYTAAKRYSVAVLTLGFSGVWFITGFIQNYQNLLAGKQIHSVVNYFQRHLLYTLPAGGALQAAVPFLSFIYLFVVAFLSVKFIVAFFNSRRGLHSQLYSAGHHIVNAVDDLCKRIGITKKVMVWLCDTPSAMTFGFIKPVVLLPVAILNQLSLAQVEAIIAHELIHIRRNDYLVNILMSFCELILFFNPFARILHHIIRKERENSCDDEVIALGYSSREYAESLYLLGSAALSKHTFALAVSGDNKYLLLDRVKRILKYRQPQPSVWKPLCLLIVFLTVAVFARKEKRVVTETKTTTTTKMISFTGSLGTAPVTEKPIIIFESHITRGITPARSHSKMFQLKFKLVKSVPPPPVPPVPPTPEELNQPEESVSAFNNMNRSFVSVAPSDIEFTIIETKPIVPPNNNAGKVMPYVPASTFYFPDIKDSLNVQKDVKKVVNI